MQISLALSQLPRLLERLPIQLLFQHLYCLANEAFLLLYLLFALPLLDQFLLGLGQLALVDLILVVSILVKPELRIAGRHPEGKLLAFEMSERLKEELALLFVHLSECLDEHLRDGLIQYALRHHRHEHVLLASHVALDPVEFEQGSLKDLDEFLYALHDEVSYLNGRIRSHDRGRL